MSTGAAVHSVTPLIADAAFVPVFASLGGPWRLVAASSTRPAPERRSHRTPRLGRRPATPIAQRCPPARRSCRCRPGAGLRGWTRHASRRSCTRPPAACGEWLAQTGPRSSCASRLLGRPGADRLGSTLQPVAAWVSGQNVWSIGAARPCTEDRHRPTARGLVPRQPHRHDQCVRLGRAVAGMRWLAGEAGGSPQSRRAMALARSTSAPASTVCGPGRGLIGAGLC